MSSQALKQLVRSFNPLARHHFTKTEKLSKFGYLPTFSMCKKIVIQSTATHFSTCVINSNEASNVNSNTHVLDNGLSLTPSCIKRLQQITTSNEPFLRITISGGGCSGFQYEFAMDSAVGPDDRFIGDDRGTALVVVDATSLSYITGSTIDYYEELIRTGFRIVGNPQAEGGCSCGASFSIKI